MDYLMLPPEVNSARMYAGPGAAPLMEASAAWGSIGTQLSLTASSITDVITGLESKWYGHSSSEMATTLTRYVTWLTTTAAQASETASQAAAAVGAYEMAFTATVPPPVIAANRALLAALVSTNFLGINTAAIMATEAHYAEMWAQDIAAMVGYHAASTQATALPTFTVPNPIAGLLEIFKPGSNQATGGLAGILNFLSGSSGSSLGSFLSSPTLNSIASSAILNPGETWAPLLMLASLGQTQQSLQYQAAALGGSNANQSDVSPEPAPVEASVGTAQQVGRLSTPQSWGQTVNETSVAEPLPTGTPEAGAPAGGLFPMAGATPGQTNSQRGPRYGTPVKVVPRLVGS